MIGTCLGAGCIIGYPTPTYEKVSIGIILSAGFRIARGEFRMLQYIHRSHGAPAREACRHLGLGRCQ